ncbi:hypothetical protein CAEBREN_13864 [Caenorhabditis brenneri]|uniref:RING-type domain-containing protein n=1 Tax=Caenorhabditis brenneri TaxID=135651 RepID=G0PHZ6_CAEBE|nr:hypothetical protein CAEBREN_13864 [Caenorhabditis brenneri]
METALINMTRYSMTEDIRGCPMEYNHGIEFNKDVMDELKNTVGFESTGQETELTLVENEQVNCLMEKINNEIHKPYTGSCGHTICSVCIEEILSGECPVCGMKKSFEGSKLNENLLQEVETIKRNAWETFKELWSNEAADFATCSKCKKYSSDLYICDIANLIWYSGSGIETMADVLKISRHILCQRCASVQEEKVYPILFWKNYLKKTNGIFLLEFLDITDNTNGIRRRRGENLEFRRVKILIKLLKELNYKYKDSCGYDRELIKLKLIDKLVQSNNQTIKPLLMPEGNPYEPIKGCPLCVMVDFRNCAENIEHDCNNWMNVFEHLWSIQSVKFEKCCIRCLLYLNDRYSDLCQTVTETSFFKSMSTVISEGIKVDVLNCFLESGFYGLQRYWDEYFTDCKDCNLLVDDKEIWQNLIIREYFLCLIQIVISGIYKTDFTCHLRKIRMHNLVYHLLLEICDVWRKHNQYWSVWWRFIKMSSKLEDLKIQFKNLKDEMDNEEFEDEEFEDEEFEDEELEDEEFEDECECTDIWERNQYMMRKFGHDEHEKRKRFEDLEESMEEMAKFSLEEDLDGCPMKYNHGIGLDEEAVRILKELTVPEEETSENECLCDVVESIESKTAISSRADIEHVVSFFINWWRYEASYPHVLCYICMHDLEFIQHHLSTLPGFYNCELRKTRMLKTFDCLLVHIRHFQLRKVRVSKSEMEEMTGVFDSFISQWNFFQFGSDSDQRPLTAGTVCHCTKTLDTTRSLQYTKEEEYTGFMIVSNELAAFNLKEIITGCPLEFDNDIDDACFDPEGISNETYRCFKLMFCDST